MTTSRDLTLTGSLINGAASSFCTITLCQSLYTIKNFRQAGKGFPSPNMLYTGYIANLCSDGTNQSVALFSNKYFATVIMGSKPLTPVERLIGGIGSGITAAPFLCICDRIVAVQQLHLKEGGKPLTITQAVRTILDAEGPKGLWRGLTPTTVRGAINFSCFFGLQKPIQEEVEKRVENKKLARYMSFSILGCSAGVVNTPVDLIKTNMQKTIGVSISSFEVANQIIKESGRRPIAALSKGWQPRIFLMGTLMPTMAFFSDNIPKMLPGPLYTNKR